MLPVGENDPKISQKWALSLYLNLFDLTHVSIILYMLSSYLATSPGGMLLASWRHRFCHHHFTIDVQKCIKDRVLDCVQATIKNFWTQFGHQKYARDRFLWNPLVDHLLLLIARFLGYIPCAETHFEAHQMREDCHLFQAVGLWRAACQAGRGGASCPQIVIGDVWRMTGRWCQRCYVRNCSYTYMHTYIQTYTYRHTDIQTYRHTYTQI